MAPVGWTLVEGPTVGVQFTADSAAFIGFANRRVEDTTPPIDPAGYFDWTARSLAPPFVAVTQFEPDIPDVFATLSQVVPGTPAPNTRFQAGPLGKLAIAAGCSTPRRMTFMKIEFLNGTTVIGTEMLNLKDAGQINDDAGGLEWDDWRQFTVNGIAPAGTTNVRVSAGATGMFNGRGPSRHSSTSFR